MAAQPSPSVRHRVPHLWTLRGLLRPLRGPLFAALFLMAAIAGLLLLLPWWFQALLVRILPAGDLSRLGLHLALGLALTFLIAAVHFLRDFLLTRISHQITAAYRQQLFERILLMPLRRLKESRVGDLISRLSLDLTVFQVGTLRVFVNFVPNLAILLAVLAGMLWHSWVLSAVTALLVLPLLLLVGAFSRRMHEAARRSHARLADLTSLLEESLSGAREIKAFVQERALLARFARLNRATLDCQVEMERVFTLHPPMITAAAGLAIAGLVFISVWLLSTHRLALPHLIGFLTCLAIAYAPLQESVRSFGFFSRIFAVMDRLEEIIEFRGESDEDVGLPELPPLTGALHFEGVHFSYPESDFALVDLTLEIAPGETVAVVGPSGAGKSTLLDLIPRFLEPDRGSIRVDGLEIRRFRRDSLRRQLGIVPQTPVLFAGTLWENLRFGRPEADDEAVRTAARAAHVDEFARRLPLGYQTPLGPRGALLSVGQRQRVALARALLAAPRILLLDEPTSALDSESERLVAAALAAAASGRTTLIIAHRMSTIRNADRILVLQDGRIVEEGSHEQLYAQRGLYYNLYSTQATADTPR